MVERIKKSQREIERREINHNEFLAIFKKSVPEENGR